MKIMFQNGKYPFCYYYRGYLPAIYTQNMCVPEFLRTENIDQNKVKAKMEEADVVVLQRPQDEARLDLVRLLKRQGKKVIFENDDTYLVGKGIRLERLENDTQRKLAVEISDMTNQIMRECDGVIASTPFLADEYRLQNPNVAVLKNCIDPLDAFTIKKNEGKKKRIGFIGSVTTNDDYLHIKDVIRELDKQDDVTIVVMGIKYNDGSVIGFMKEDEKFWASLNNIEWHSYVPILSYMNKLSNLRLDLALIPREDNYFNRAKSNLKFLELSLFEVPVIAEGFSGSPYQHDKDYLTLVTDKTLWYTHIKHALDNLDTYKDKAKEARKFVLANYNIKTYAPQWVDTIQFLCKYQQSF